MKTGCIIQARNTSSRLPKKVMKYLPFDSNITVLEHVIARVKKSQNVDTIIIATTTNSDDDSICELAHKLGVKYFRGSEDDVLSRYYLAAKENKLDQVIRITSDCPCLDSELLDELILFHRENRFDYSSNSYTRTLPHGMDAEIMEFRLLEEAYENANTKFEKEHVTPYIYSTNRDKFNIGIFTKNYSENVPEIRVTLDTYDDYMLLGAVFDYLRDTPNFGVDDIINLFENKPWLYKINSSIVQKKKLDTFELQKEEAIKVLKKQELELVANFLSDNNES
ncbi:MAG: glycosyltransferase family protein [Erysipelotrichales bacterium]